MVQPNSIHVYFHPYLLRIPFFCPAFQNINGISLCFSCMFTSFGSFANVICSSELLQALSVPWIFLFIPKFHLKRLILHCWVSSQLLVILPCNEPGCYFLVLIRCTQLSSEGVLLYILPFKWTILIHICVIVSALSCFSGLVSCTLRVHAHFHTVFCFFIYFGRMKLRPWFQLKKKKAFARYGISYTI